MSTKEKLHTAGAALADLADSIENDARDDAWLRRQIADHTGAVRRIAAARIASDVSLLGGSEVEAEVAMWVESADMAIRREAATSDRVTERDERIAELDRDLAQNAAVTETLRAELAEARRLLATYAVTVVGDFGGVPVVEVKVAEEQGPWVVHDSHRDAGTRWCGEMDESGNDWRRNLADVTPFKTRAEATEFVRGFANTVEAVALTQGAPFDEALPPAPGTQWVVVDNEGRPLFLRGLAEGAHMWTRRLEEASTFTEVEARARVKPGVRHVRAVTTETARRIVADYARRGQPVPPTPAENES